MIFAIIGLVLLFFALVGFLSGAGVWLAYGHLGAGIGFLVYGLLTSAGELRELAGRDASRRGARLGGNAFVQLVALAAILGAVAFLSVRYDTKWDWTESGIHTLTRATVQVLEQIPEDAVVEIYAFHTAGSEEPTRRALEMYTYESERVRYSIFDPNQRPDLAERFEIQQDGLLLVCSGACDSTQATVRVMEPSEQEVTRAIRTVLSSQKKLYFLTGHGEGAIDDDQATGFSRIKGALEGENLVVEPLLLANVEAVPDDAAAVVVAGPTHSVLDRELERLDAYLKRGGSLAVLVDPFFVTNLEEQVRKWGVELGSDVIVDQTIGLFTGPQIGVQPVVSEYGEHPITKDLADAATMFWLARSVGAANGADVTELAFTGPSSWAETNLELFTKENKVGLDANEDREGPIAIAAVRTFAPAAGDVAAGDAEQEPGEGRLVVVGDADFARNRHIAKVYNADFFLNMVNWLVGEEQFITIDRKTPRASMAQLTRQQFSTFQYIALFFLPEAILLAGIVNWWRRRS